MHGDFNPHSRVWHWMSFKVPSSPNHSGMCYRNKGDFCHKLRWISKTKQFCSTDFWRFVNWNPKFDPTLSCYDLSIFLSVPFICTLVQCPCHCLGCVPSNISSSNVINLNSSKCICHDQPFCNVRTQFLIEKKFLKVEVCYFLRLWKN